MHLVFHAKAMPSKVNEDNAGTKEAWVVELFKDTSEVRMVTVSIGIIQSLVQVSYLEIEWPSVFSLVTDFLKNLAFQLNYFHPECSVELPAKQKWIGMLLIPYCFFGILTLAYLFARSSKLV